MMGNSHPGYTDALALGYSPYSHSADNTSATYTKGALNLTVSSDGSASLCAVCGLVTISLAGFSPFPHPKLELFEKKILERLPEDQGGTQAMTTAALKLAKMLKDVFERTGHPRCPDPDCEGAFEALDADGAMILDHSEGCVFKAYVDAVERSRQ